MTGFSAAKKESKVEHIFHSGEGGGAQIFDLKIWSKNMT
jgi:hypothetical protein